MQVTKIPDDAKRSSDSAFEPKATHFPVGKIVGTPPPSAAPSAKALIERAEKNCDR